VANVIMRNGLVILSVPPATLYSIVADVSICTIWFTVMSDLSVSHQSPHQIAIRPDGNGRQTDLTRQRWQTDQCVGNIAEQTLESQPSGHYY